VGLINGSLVIFIFAQLLSQGWTADTAASGLTLLKLNRNHRFILFLLCYIAIVLFNVAFRALLDLFHP